jgi:hypothetical protein
VVIEEEVVDRRGPSGAIVRFLEKTSLLDGNTIYVLISGVR